MSYWCYLTLWISNSLFICTSKSWLLPWFNFPPPMLWVGPSKWYPDCLQWAVAALPAPNPHGQAHSFQTTKFPPLQLHRLRLKSFSALSLLAAWQAWPRDLALQIYSSSLQLLWNSLVCFHRTNSPRAAQYSPNCRAISDFFLAIIIGINP